MVDLEESMQEIVRAAMEVEATIEALYDRAPRLCTGEDNKKLVKVAVGRHGDLEELSINFEWERSYRPNEIGGAILEAVEVAYTNQLSAISKSSKRWSEPAVTQEEVDAYLKNQADLVTSSAFFDPSVSPMDAAEEFIAMAEGLRNNNFEFGAEVKRPRQPVVVEKLSGNWISDIYIDNSWARGRSATGISSAVLKAAKEAKCERRRPGIETLESMLGLLNRLQKEGVHSE